MENKDTFSGTAVDGPAGRPPDISKLLTRLQEQTRLLQRNAQALRQALHEVDTAVAVSRARVFRVERRPSARTDASAGATEDGNRRSEPDRRSGADRRRKTDPVAALVRWIDGEGMDRRTEADRRQLADRRCSEPPSADTREQPECGPVPGDNVVSLDVFRSQRARTQPAAR